MEEMLPELLVSLMLVKPAFELYKNLYCILNDSRNNAVVHFVDLHGAT